MPDFAIKFENISKFYKLYDSPKDRLKEALHPFGKKKFHKEFYALKNTNLEVKKGEILGIVGRNGSGKSTLLKLISGVIQPSSGEMVVNGNIAALLELGSGLHPEFSGVQNIYFSGTMMGFTREEMDEKIEPIVQFADIGAFIHQPLKTYSSGMKARLGFALAINIDPDILILDEVLAVGDELFKRKCYAKMGELFKSGCTVFYVSHAINSVNEICSRAIFLDRGELILDGPPKLVTMYYQKYLFATPENAAKTRAEIIQLNKDEEKKKRFASNLEENGTKTTAKEKESPHIYKDKREQVEKQIAFYIPDFKPKSTVVTKNYDVEISDIQINTLDGKKVNALVINDQYIFSYRVKFGYKAENVFSNIIFKTEKGFRLGSDVSPGRDKFLEGVAKGSEYLYKWHFDCRLLPGNYYMNIAVRSNINGDYIILNRIEDAIVFKVLKDPDISYKGIVHFSQYADIYKLK